MKKCLLFPPSCFALFAAAVAAPTSRADIAVSAAFPGGRLCAKDAVHVVWTVREWSGGTELVWIDVHDTSRIVNNSNNTGSNTSSTQVARFDVFQYDAQVPRGSSSSLNAVGAVPHSLKRLHSVIHCRQDGPYKTPGIRTVRFRSRLV